MDRDLRSPETEELRERAGSSEAASIRPNPFEHDAENLRKRRRTASKPDSHSRSVETDLPPPQPTPEDSAMTIDSSRTATPRSLDVDDKGNTPPTQDQEKSGSNRSSGQADGKDDDGQDAQPPPPATSHVTLNLRNPEHGTVHTIPSTPSDTSSPPQSPTPARSRRPLEKDATQANAEQPDSHVVAQKNTGTGAGKGDAFGAPGAAGTADVAGYVGNAVPGPAVSSSPMARPGTASSPVEVIEIQADDDDADFEPADPPVTLLAEEPNSIHNSVLVDPTPDFPYQNASESPAEIMTKILSYITTDATVAQNIREWIDSFLNFAKNSSIAVVYESYVQHRSLWFALPELIWGVPGLRSPASGTMDPLIRERLLDLCYAFSRLTASFVTLDAEILGHIVATGGSPPQEMISFHYLCAWATTVKRDVLCRSDDFLGGPLPIDDISEIVDEFVSFHHLLPYGTLQVLAALLQAELSLMPRYPKMIDNVTQSCIATATIVRESHRRLTDPDLPPQYAIVMKSRIVMGHELFLQASSALNTMLDNHITHVSYENACQQLAALGDMVHISLRVDHPQATEFVSDFHGAHPDVPLGCIPEAFSMEWRFGIYSRLIKCSQMQLRVMAVSNLCQDLVNLWKRYGEQTPENLQEPIFLRFVAEFLVQTGVVSYLLGPTCHPEITAESSNIFGFLAIVRCFTNAHVDLFWQTVTTTQDPRISDALIRSTNRIVQLFSYEAALYLCRKFLVLPIAAFTPSMRDFCTAVLQQVCMKFDPEDTPLDTVPFVVCLRLLRDSSVPGTTTPTAYPEVQNFAIDKLSELLRSFNLDAEQRQSLYGGCLSDLKEKSSTTLGSLCAINIINRHYGGRDLDILATDHNLTALVVDELDHTARKKRDHAFPEVISGPTNSPRRDIIFQILKNLPFTLTPDLSALLWNVMAGPEAPCENDRNASWRVFITCAQRTRAENNPFLTLALRDFVPRLPPNCFCDGLLGFLRGYLTPLLVDKNSQLLDPVDETVRKTQALQSWRVDQLTLEQLWRVALTAPPGTIECQAIDFLVKDVYIESQCIRALAVERARKVHLAVVNRCLKQLSTAATKLKQDSKGASAASPASGDDNSMVIVGPESLIQEEEVIFIRSLQVLQLFVQLYSSGSQFATPDLRNYIPERANSVDGESAELMYQSFDGDKQTEILPLNIGQRNTAGSLLATIREATGFDSYRMYYRGKAFFIQKRDIRRSLEELRIQNGLILVKRDADPSTARDSHALPSVEGEIMSHFDELWGYLSMGEKLASGIYEFLSNSSGNERFFQFEKDGLSYDEVFIVGQPYKSLYALHALKGFVANCCGADKAIRAGDDSDAVVAAVATDKAQQQGPDPMLDSVKPCPAERTLGSTDKTPAAEKHTPTGSSAVQGTDGGSVAEPARGPAEALTKALGLTIAAICDPKVTEESVSDDLRILLYIKLIDVLQSILKASHEGGSLRYNNLDATLLERLMDILTFALDQEQREDAKTLIRDVFGIILEVCALSRDCWDAFKTHKDAVTVTEQMLLSSNNEGIQQTAEKQLVDKAVTGSDASAVDAAEFRRFFWPVVLEIVPKALGETAECKAIFNLVDSFMKKMIATAPPTLDVPDVLRQAGDMLLSYTTTDEFSDADDHTDYAMFGLLRMFTTAYHAAQDLELQNILPRNFGNRLFWRHLFPPWRSVGDERSTSETQTGQKLYPRVVMHTAIREMLMRTLFELADDTPNLLLVLVRNLDQLVPCEKAGDDDPYHYELPPLFDRSKALRAPCGYAGLRNLSNTCYFNSLFTQLFMNVGFRQFMMNVDIRDENKTQALLFQTRVLFGFLQDSIRRFVDTQMCVASVKSYDDTSIDIHNQMDVDEFYNLLFDRWEGQLQSASEKQTFRTFYGGQLVQQVRSKECEHVSENLDPFSAIQLVIKGKASLAESLEAYVGGEVLEGDNKYKCSKCDRHVDAVKRSCLKEMPDNLIFHLKRFDFNLRTLQRSKINDYFSFPHKIDMRPYTIEYLSDPSKEHPPDMFELVGVLVHSGTAESGHYYSFIRERPSSNTGNSWVEFNDDAVSAWDPAQMDALCFGGTEFRPNSQYGGGGGDSSNGVLVDKAFSAYMLFYQRSSTLAQEQAALAESKLPSPARAAMPTALAEHIRSENTLLIRRHVLFDPKHIPFVCEVLDQLRAKGACSKEHVVENTAVQMAISHLDQVASRTREPRAFDLLHGRLMSMCARCAQCSLAVVDYFDERPEILRQMLQRTLEPGVRIDSGALLIQAFQKIKAAHPELYGVCGEDEYGSGTDEEDADGLRDRRMAVDREGTVLRSAARMMRTLWSHFHAVIRSWPEVFGFMVDFVNLGRAELAVFLEVGGLRRAIMAISADPNVTVDAQYARLLAALQRRPSNRPPSYENLITLIDAMLSRMYALRSAEEAVADDDVDRYALALRHPDADLPMSRSELSLLKRDWLQEYGNVFVDKLISLNQETAATDSVLARLMATIPIMEDKVLSTLKANISGSATACYQEPFLRVARLLVRRAQSSGTSVQMLQHLAVQCRGLCNPEGRAFFETLVSMYHGQTGTEQQPTVDVAAMLRGLQALPIWVPGLLGYYYDTSVSNDVEDFLQDSVFRFGRTPQFSEDEGGAQRAAAVVTAAKELGVHCLRYIRLHVVQRNVNISQSKSVAFQRVLMACRPYYEGGVAAAAAAAASVAEETTAAEGDAVRDDVLSAEFRELDSTIPDLLKRLAVEDVEEDGSVSDEQDWGSSRCSSDGGESMGDASLQTAAELHDVDML